MPKTFSNILVPIDFSEDADRAVEACLELFGDKAESIKLLTVCESRGNRHTEMLPEIDEVMEQTVNDKIIAFAKNYEGRHKNLKAYIKNGQPASQILSVAKEMEVDLIVMGSQGRNSLARVLFGSTTYEVSRKAHCSVFVVRP